VLLGKGVMINWSDVAPGHRPAYYEWHSREHMVGRVGLSGFRRGRRYIAADARRDFLVMYEVSELAFLAGEEYLTKANAPSPLTQRTTPFVKNSIRGLAMVRATFGIGTGGCALTLRFGPRADGAEALERYLANDVLPRLAAIPEITGAHLLVADKQVSGIVPVERKGRPTVIPDWIVLLEGVTFEALETAANTALSDRLLGEHGAADRVERDTYSLQIMVGKAAT
jgi:hypothetical protein